MGFEGEFRQWENNAADRRLKIRMADQACSALEESGKPECVKSTGPIEPQVRRVVCVVLRVAYDPLPIPPGLLRRRNLHRLVGIVLHVADREPLDLNSLLRLLLSHLECIWFRPTRQVVLWRIGVQVKSQGQMRQRRRRLLNFHNIVILHDRCAGRRSLPSSARFSRVSSICWRNSKPANTTSLPLTSIALAGNTAQLAITLGNPASRSSVA